MRTILFIVLLLTACRASAATISPIDGMEAMRAAFASTDDMVADITQEKQLYLLRKKMIMRGKVRFKKPDLFMIEFLPPFGSRLLMRDGVVEQRIEGEEKGGRIVLPPEYGLKRWFDRLSRPVTSLPDGMEVRADLTEGLYTLDISPVGKGQMKRLSLQFSREGGMKRLTLDEKNGDRSVMTFRNIRRNTGLSAKDFKL